MSIPEGWHSVTPRIVVDDPAKLVAFLQRVFGATGSFRAEAPSVIGYGDRRGMVRDPWGNTWQIATHRR
jgi:uncharacterized glyoxalase superfamily protein PhnB